MRSKYVTPRFVLYLVILVVTMLVFSYQMHKAREVSSREQETFLGRDWMDIDGKSTLIIATDYGVTPSRHDTRELEHLYRLAQLVKRRTGVEVEVRLESRLDNLLDALEQGEIDLLAGNLPRTSSVDTIRFSWMRPILIGPVLLAQRNDTAILIKSQLELSGKTIALPSGSAYKIFVEHLAQEMGIDIYTKEYPNTDIESIVKLIQDSQADYTLCPSYRSQYYVALYPDLDISLPITYTLRSGWLLRSTSRVLQDSISSWLRALS